MSAAHSPPGLRLRLCSVAAWFTIGAVSAQASDWTQYRGGNHDATSSDRITKNWSGSVTNPVWLTLVTNGLSSFSVSGGRAFTQIRRSIDGTDMEVCVGLSITNGAELWATTVDLAVYDGGVGYDDGPRTTPAFEGGSVFVLSSYLNLFRLNATNGAVIWQKDLISLYGGYVIGWQNAASPVIENGLIYLNANSPELSLMALRTSDGEPAWRSQNDGMTHSTPVLATIDGVRQVIFATQSGLVSLDPLSGNLLWRTNYPFSYSTSLAVSPVVYQNMIFICGAHAYGMGSMVVQATRTNATWTLTRLWATNNPASHWMTPVAYQGYLYGQFGIQSFDSTTAQFKCIDMRTGLVKWSQPNFGRGGTILVNDLLVAVTEPAEIVLVRPDPNAYIELGRFLAIPDYGQDNNKVWNSPAVADGRVYIRSTSYAGAFDFSMPDLKLDRPVRTPGKTLQLTVRTATGSPIDSNRFAGLEIRGSTNSALAPALWTRITNSLLLTNGLVRATNVDASSATRRFFIVSEPK